MELRFVIKGEIKKLMRNYIDEDWIGNLYRSWVNNIFIFNRLCIIADT